MPERIERNPVYQQLNELLRSLIAKQYGMGDQFLTEREISERFDVSRATANKALASLVSEGLLEFRRGIGTFIRRDVIDYDVRSLVSFTEKAKLAGKKPRTQLLRFQAVASNSIDCAIARQLLLPADAEVWEMERLRFADSTPVIFEHRYVVKSLCPRLTRTQATGSLYQAWIEKHHLQIAGADEVIRAVLLSTREAKQLRTTTHSPALEVIAIGTLVGQIPLWWERTVYRGDQYEFHSRLGPIQSATPARGVLRPHPQPALRQPAMNKLTMKSKAKEKT